MKVKGVIYALLIVGASFMTSHALDILKENEGGSQTCLSSKHYKYNHTSVYYTWGKCYVEETHTYETKNVCQGGVLGIGQSCYEASEAHREFYSTTECFDPETGDSC